MYTDSTVWYLHIMGSRLCSTHLAGSAPLPGPPPPPLQRGDRGGFDNRRSTALAVYRGAALESIVLKHPAETVFNEFF